MSDVCSYKEDGKGGAKPATLSLAHASLVSIDHLQPGRSQDLTLVSQDRVGIQEVIVQELGQGGGALRTT